MDQRPRAADRHPAFEPCAARRRRQLAERGELGEASIRHGRRQLLIAAQWPFAACAADPKGAPCVDALANIQNPFYLGDQPGGTQVSGWLDAWTPAPSAYAVKARSSGDVAAAVNFARDNNLRLVVKGAGHSYQGTSNAPDSLLIWTRAMDNVTLHDAFTPQGCEGKVAPSPAVTAEAGAVWIDLYHAVVSEGGRYVQGGGCTDVGVAGLIQSGGFGSFSKRFGTAASWLLEAEIVTADGAVRIANACTNPDLFWAIKGGGGGSWGVVTRLTLRTHDLPAFFGGVWGTIKAQSDDAFRRLIARFFGFYADDLFNAHWGEQVAFAPDNTLKISMVCQGLDSAARQAVWKPFSSTGSRRGNRRRTFPSAAVRSRARAPPLPARRFWDVCEQSVHAIAPIPSRAPIWARRAITAGGEATRTRSACSCTATNRSGCRLRCFRRVSASASRMRSSPRAASSASASIATRASRARPTRRSPPPRTPRPIPR